MNNKELEKKLLEDIRQKQTDNDIGTVYVTEGLLSDTKRVVQRAKRNYAQVYLKADNSKLFHSYTKSVCDSLISQLDFNISDISLISKSSDTTNQVQALRELAAVYLKKAGFATTLNEIMTRAVVDGVVVTRTELVNKKPLTKVINMENLWFESDNSHPEWLLERTLLNKNDVPKNWTYIKESHSSSIYPNIGFPQKKGVEAHIFEGLLPLEVITEDSNDTQRKWMRLYITGLGDGQTAKIQEVQLLGDSMYDGHYDCAQFTSQEGRFIGVGIPEMLFDIQKYLNSNLTMRYRKGSLPDLLQYRKKSGLTSDLVSRLQVGGAIPVENIGDIAEVSKRGITNDNFLEEERLLGQGDRLTGSTEISRGQRERQATLGQVQIESAFSNKRFDYSRQNVATMVESILTKWSKAIVENMKPEEVIRVTDQNLRKELAEEYAASKLALTLDEQLKSPRGALAVDAALKKFNADSFYEEAFLKNEWKLRKEFAKNLEYEVAISITNQDSDNQRLVNNLTAIMPLLEALPETDRSLLVSKTMELLGINKSQFKTSVPTPTAAGLPTQQLGAVLAQ